MFGFFLRRNDRHAMCVCVICMNAARPIVVNICVHVEINGQYVRPEDKNFKRITSQHTQNKEKERQQKKTTTKRPTNAQKTEKTEKGILCLVRHNRKPKPFRANQKTSQRKKEKKIVSFFCSRAGLSHFETGDRALFHTKQIGYPTNWHDAHILYFFMFCAVFLFDFPLKSSNIQEKRHVHRWHRLRNVRIFFFGLTALGMRCVIFSCFSSSPIHFRISFLVFVSSTFFLDCMALWFGFEKTMKQKIRILFYELKRKKNVYFMCNLGILQ